MAQRSATLSPLDNPQRLSKGLSCSGVPKRFSLTGEAVARGVIGRCILIGSLSFPSRRVSPQSAAHFRAGCACRLSLPGACPFCPAELALNPLLTLGRDVRAGSACGSLSFLSRCVGPQSAVYFRARCACRKCITTWKNKGSGALPIKNHAASPANNRQRHLQRKYCIMRRKAFQALLDN